MGALVLCEIYNTNLIYMDIEEQSVHMYTYLDLE